jgi:rhodanese-related sulfurtransferase
MRQLDGPELVARCADASQPAPTLLDVREAWEFARAAIHVDGIRTLHIPMNEVPARLGELEPAQPVVCICHHGMRSAQVVAFLEHHGFTAVYNLAGGIAAWSERVDPAVPRY